MTNVTTLISKLVSLTWSKRNEHRQFNPCNEKEMISNFRKFVGQVMVECLKGYKTKSETELFLEINGGTVLPALS
jgi:hypothetical protein